jgi:hypothetical protein
LAFIDQHPDAIPFVGLIPCGPNAFLVNSDLCAAFFGIRRNSCNRNFQQHAFRVDNQGNVADELARRCPNLIGEERHWVKRVFLFGLFNADSTREQVEVASAHARSVRGNQPFAVSHVSGTGEAAVIVVPAASEGEMEGWGSGSGIEGDMNFSMAYDDSYFSFA